MVLNDEQLKKIDDAIDGMFPGVKVIAAVLEMPTEKEGMEAQVMVPVPHNDMELAKLVLGMAALLGDTAKNIARTGLAPCDHPRCVMMNIVTEAMRICGISMFAVENEEHTGPVH